MNVIYQVQILENIGVSEFDVKMLIASKLFEDGRLSSGQAAKIVGIYKRAFIEILGKYGVSIFGYDFDELQEDIKN